MRNKKARSLLGEYQTLYELENFDLELESSPEAYSTARPIIYSNSATAVHTGDSDALDLSILCMHVMCRTSFTIAVSVRVMV